MVLQALYGRSVALLQQPATFVRQYRQLREMHEQPCNNGCRWHKPERFTGKTLKETR